MNTGPGNTGKYFRRWYRDLWLFTLFLPISVMAQQQTPAMPGYYPGPVTNPFYQYQNLVPAPVPGNTQRPTATQQPYRVSPFWGYPSIPGAPGYQTQQPALAQIGRPYLETTVDSTEAYVHQNLVMTIQVISVVNIKTVSLELEDNDDVIFRQLGDITVSTRNRQGQREIVNTLYYQLTPLRGGQIELEPVRVSGVLDVASPNGTSFNAVASRPVKLTVSNPEPGVQPWLPLHQLELNVRLSNDERIGEGEPLTLTVEQQAVGMSGTQLPSVESQLRGPGHRLYLEKTEYQGTITKQGTLVGTRTDRFTLVPLQGNRVEIPAIRVDWWNVKRQRKETAVLHSRLLNELHSRPGEEPQSGVSELGEARGPLLMWLSLLAIAFLLGRFWTRLTPVLKRSIDWLWQQLGAVGEPVHRHLTTVLVYLSPQRNLHLLRRRVAENLPRSARLWFCVRSADEEQDADDWSQVLRFLISRRLGLSAQLPMSKLAELIIDIHPGADPEKVRALLNELEAALFAGRKMRDFNTWKKEFKYQVRPRPFAWLRRNQQAIRVAGLPSLNPTMTS